MTPGAILILGKALLFFGGLLAFGAWELYSLKRSRSEDQGD